MNGFDCKPSTIIFLDMYIYIFFLLGGGDNCPLPSHNAANAHSCYKVCGIRDQEVGSGITAWGSGITNHGIGISSFLRDQAVPFLWDQGPKFVTILESRI